MLLLALHGMLLAAPSMGYRLVALDMDGTALNRDHRLSEYSLRTLRSLSARGVSVALCSGRSIMAIQEHAAELALPEGLPVVSFNGACGLLASGPSWLSDADAMFTTPVPEEVVPTVLEVCEDAGLMVQYYVGNDIYVVCKNDEHVALTKKYVQLTGVPAHVYVESYEEAKAKGPPYKMLVMIDESRVDATLALLQEKLPKGCVKLIRGSPPFFVEVLHPEVDKGEGLKRLCEGLRIPLDDVVAFGDGDNDIEFCQMAGLGVAMSNARDTLKEVACRITERSHEDDGVAHALEQMEANGELSVIAPRVVALRDAKPDEPSVTIRRVQPADVAALREKVLWPGQPEKCVLPEDESSNAIHLAALAETDSPGVGLPSSRVVGVLSLFLQSAEQPQMAQFRKLATDPDWRSRGIGRSLISTAVAEARREKASNLVCDAREPQLGFYESLGFARSGEPFAKYGSSGEMYVRMNLDL